MKRKNRRKKHICICKHNLNEHIYEKICLHDNCSCNNYFSNEERQILNEMSPNVDSLYVKIVPEKLQELFDKAKIDKVNYYRDYNNRLDVKEKRREYMKKYRSNKRCNSC